MDKITPMEESDVKLIREKFGDFNDFPPNWKEMNEKEFAQSIFFSYSPSFMEYRQMLKREKDGSFKREQMVGAHLFHYWDKTGVALVNDWWKGKVRYFKFALCEHDYKELSQKEAKQKGLEHWGMCWHVYECQKCGLTMSQDSSD